MLDVLSSRGSSERADHDPHCDATWEAAYEMHHWRFFNGNNQSFEGLIRPLSERLFRGCRGVHVGLFVFFFLFCSHCGHHRLLIFISRPLLEFGWLEVVEKTHLLEYLKHSPCQMFNPILYQCSGYKKYFNSNKLMAIDN